MAGNNSNSTAKQKEQQEAADKAELEQLRANKVQREADDAELSALRAEKAEREEADKVAAEDEENKEAEIARLRLAVSDNAKTNEAARIAREADELASKRTVDCEVVRTIALEMGENERRTLEERSRKNLSFNGVNVTIHPGTEDEQVFVKLSKDEARKLQKAGAVKVAILD